MQKALYIRPYSKQNDNEIENNEHLLLCSQSHGLNMSWSCKKYKGDYPTLKHRSIFLSFVGYRKAKTSIFVLICWERIFQSLNNKYKNYTNTKTSKQCSRPLIKKFSTPIKLHYNECKTFVFENEIFAPFFN